jgi:hypothetical protein
MKSGDLAALESEFDLVSFGGSAVEIAWVADLVVGMTSMLMVEAALMGRSTLAVLPRDQEKSWLPTIRMGLTRCVTERRELRQELKELISFAWRNTASMAEDMFPSGAADRVSDLLCHLR